MSVVCICRPECTWTLGALLQTCQLNLHWRLDCFTDPQVSVTNCPVRGLRKKWVNYKSNTALIYQPRSTSTDAVYALKYYLPLQPRHKHVMHIHTHTCTCPKTRVVSSRQSMDEKNEVYIITCSVTTKLSPVSPCLRFSPSAFYMPALLVQFILIREHLHHLLNRFNEVLLLSMGFVVSEAVTVLHFKPQLNITQLLFPLAGSNTLQADNYGTFQAETTWLLSVIPN